MQSEISTFTIFCELQLMKHVFYRDSHANEGVVDKLTPFTSYKVYIRACNNTQPLSEVLDIRTKQDGKFLFFLGISSNFNKK